jgi:hypothetical protein
MKHGMLAPTNLERNKHKIHPYLSPHDPLKSQLTPAAVLPFSHSGASSGSPFGVFTHEHMVVVNEPSSASFDQPSPLDLKAPLLIKRPVLPPHDRDVGTVSDITPHPDPVSLSSSARPLMESASLSVGKKVNCDSVSPAILFPFEEHPQPLSVSVIEEAKHGSGSPAKFAHSTSSPSAVDAHNDGTEARKPELFLNVLPSDGSLTEERGAAANLEEEEEPDERDPLLHAFSRDETAVIELDDSDIVETSSNTLVDARYVRFSLNVG